MTRTASTHPAQSEYEAQAQEISLKSAARVLGVDSVALIETMKSCKGMNFIGGMPQFMEVLFGRLKQHAEKTPPQQGGDLSKLSDNTGN